MSNARNLANLLGTGTTIASAKIADDAITNAKIADDAVTGAKIEDSPTIAGNLTIAGTTTAQGLTVGFVAPDKILLNATDGSATDAGDNLVLNSTDGSSDDGDNILYEDDTSDASSLIGTSNVVLSSPKIVGVCNYSDRPAFDIRGSTYNSILEPSSNTWTKIPYGNAGWSHNTAAFGQSGYNIGGHWDTTNYVFKPTIAGLWMLEATAYWTFGSDAPDSIALNFTDQDGHTLGTNYVRSGDSTDEVYGSSLLRQIFKMSGNGTDAIEIQGRSWNSSDSDIYYSSFYGHVQGIFLG